MATPTNDWDLILALNQDLISKMISNLFNSGRISTTFDEEINNCLIELTITDLAVALGGSVSDTDGQGGGETSNNSPDNATAPPDEPCAFTGNTQLMTFTAEVNGTMTCENAAPQKLDGSVIITMNLAEVTFNAINQMNYLQLGGDSSAADCGNLNTFTSDGCTLEAWIKTSSKDFQTLMLFGDASPSFSIVNDNLRLYWGDKPYDSNDPTRAVISDGKWHHVAITVDSGTIYFYTDGQFKNHSPLPSEQQSVASLLLGTAYSYSFGAASAFNGSVTEARVWNYAQPCV